MSLLLTGGLGIGGTEETPEVVPPTLTPSVAIFAKSTGSALPRDLALDADGDLDFSSGDIRLTSETEAIEQALDIAYGMVKGEWFLNLDAGFDLFGVLLTDHPSQTLINEEVRRVALSVPGVTGITNLSVDIDRPSRSADIDLVATSDFGVIRRSIQVGGTTEATT